MLVLATRGDALKLLGGEQDATIMHTLVSLSMSPVQAGTTCREGGPLAAVGASTVNGHSLGCFGTCTTIAAGSQSSQAMLQTMRSHCDSSAGGTARGDQLGVLPLAALPCLCLIHWLPALYCPAAVDD